MLHQYSFVKEINLQTYISPTDGNTTSSLDQTWHNQNSPRGSYLVSPALSDHFAVCVAFGVKGDSEADA